MSLDTVPTPSFLVDLDIIKKNARAMTNRCSSLGLKLRPHMKTVKTIEAGELATDGTKRRICVSTLAEAEFFAENNFDDILFAKLFTNDQLSRMQTLVKQVELFHVVIDSLYGCKLLDDNPLPGGKRWSVYLLVDTGSGREGSIWNETETLKLGELLSNSPNVDFRGLYTHEGASYEVSGSESIRSVCNETVQRIRYVSKRLSDMGCGCMDVTLGATPTASVPGEDLQGITEIHPGNYLFYDKAQEAIGSCCQSDIACRVATRVVGQYPDRGQLLIDAGWSAVSLDGPLKNGSYGTFQGHPHLKLVKLEQEYGFVEYDHAHHTIADFPHGLMLYLYPVHSCHTSSCHRKYYIHEGSALKSIWTPCSQW